MKLTINRRPSVGGATIGEFVVQGNVPGLPAIDPKQKS